MLKADMSGDALTGCCLAAERILERDGMRNQSSGEIRCTHGDLVFTRTNGNEIEIRYRGEIGLKVFPEGTNRQPIWLPGDWVHEVDRIDQQVITSHP